MMDYMIESLDKRPGWHKVKTIRNINKIETTPRHFILTTSKNKTIKLRTDTWKTPEPVQSGKAQGWHEPADHTGKAPLHKIVATRDRFDDVLREPMRQSDKTEMFRKDFRKELIRLKKIYWDDTTILEFQRWLRYDLMPFSKKPIFEQVTEKIDYEIEIGNGHQSFKDIEAWLDFWIDKNEEQPDTYIWYHGTTEEKYKKIVSDGEIRISTAKTIQYSGFEHDIGTISLSKFKSMAHFFSAIAGRGKKNQVILHIDIRQLDSAAISKRKLINTPDGEILYRKNIPASAIVKVETVHIAG